MLAVVNQPRTRNTEAASFRIEGNVPKFVVMFLESAFNKALKVEVSDEDEDEDVAIPVEESEWYREIKASMTAGDTVKADRGLRGWTQKVLAQKMGISVQNLSDPLHTELMKLVALANKLLSSRYCSTIFMPISLGRDKTTLG